jgi:hypothetical protein
MLDSSWQIENKHTFNLRSCTKEMELTQCAHLLKYNALSSNGHEFKLALPLLVSSHSSLPSSFEFGSSTVGSLP